MSEQLEVPPPNGAWTHPQLLTAEATGQQLQFLPFWGHTPPSDSSIGPHVLSQWFEHRFTYDGVSYQTAEHFMMAEKARLFDDNQRLEQILLSATPGEAKQLGREVQGFSTDKWEHHRFEIVCKASVAKFKSSPDLRRYLTGTGLRVLVEASPRDKIWGIGMSRDNPLLKQPSRWKGLNLLGFALMEARARLQTG